MANQQQQRKPGANATLGGGGIHHVAIRVRDFGASIRFYTQALGFKEKIRWGEGDGRAIMLDTGDGNYLEMFAGGKGPVPEGALLHFAIRTSDTTAALERARGAGAEVTMEPRSLTIQSTPSPTPVRIAFFKGPDGEIVELFENELT